MNLIGSMLMVLLALLGSPGDGAEGKDLIRLPAPSVKGAFSVEEALKQRRTVRRFPSRNLDRSQVSQLLWAAYGVSEPGRGYKTAPSAGALYPLEIYLVAGERGVDGLAPGVYRYLPAEHALELCAPGDQRAAVARASLHQTWMAQAPVMVLFAAEYDRCTRKYGKRGVRYTHMEVGHAAQNLFLQAEALGLGAGIVGAFDDGALSRVCNLAAAHEPQLVMPVGYK